GRNARLELHDEAIEALLRMRRGANGTEAPRLAGSSVTLGLLAVAAEARELVSARPGGFIGELAARSGTPDEPECGEGGSKDDEAMKEGCGVHGKGLRIQVWGSKPPSFACMTRPLRPSCTEIVRSPV